MSNSALTMDDILAVVKPHNDKIVAEHRLAEAEAKIERLHAYIFDLKSALGGCAALMQSDIEDRGITLSETRRRIIATAHELSRHQHKP